MRTKGYFKGRITKVSGSEITIDTKAEQRTIKDPKTGEQRLLAIWDKPEPMPKVGDVVRGRFRVKE